MPAAMFHRGVRRGIATVCLSGAIEDKLTAAAQAGFDGVEIFENDLIASSLAPADIRRITEDLGLSIDLYQPFRDAEGVPPHRWGTVVRRAERKFDVMAELGADLVLMCSSVAADTIDDDDLAAGQLQALADAAADRGMRIAYEALAWGRHVSTWEHCWEIVQMADHPALGLCLDSFHVLSRVPDATGIAALPGQKIFFLQLADAPRLNMDVLQWSRHHRVFPGQGSFNLVEFTAAVLATGYGGPLSLEVFNDVFRQSNPARTAIDAMRSLADLEDRLARHSVANGYPSPCLSAPDAPALHGIAFTEVAVDGVSGDQVADSLRALGFQHTGQHRSKPVQLWEQNSARIVLNSAVVRIEQAIGSAQVNAFALISDDPAQSAARATSMLAEPVTHRRDPFEADLHAVRAPDDVEIVFCPTVAGSEVSWRDDFLPTGAIPTSDAELLATDHVALTQPFDSFDEAGLFYHSVLALSDPAPGEFAAPFGLVRTLAEANDTGTVRIALSSALLRRGDWAPGVSDPQHIAFASKNIVRTADVLRANGAPLLAIPANYYRDLAARTGMDETRLDQLEQRGILYDADDDGEFLHMYTGILGGRLFFEIVERIGRYPGYGAINTAVRMAAHRSERLKC